MSVPPLAICVIVHNGQDVLGKCLDAASEAAPAGAELVVVDAGSTDGSDAIAERHRTAPRVVRLGRNAGPGAARNRGWIETRAERVLFSDADVFLERGCVEHLTHALDEYPGAVAAMPRVCRADDPGTIDFDGADCHFLGLMALHHAGDRVELAPTRTRSMGSIVTAGFLLDRARWGEEPPFDEAFFFNLEDHDFGVRARCAGHEIVSVPEARCLHGSGTPGLSVRGDAEPGSLRQRCLIRNRWWILAKVYSLRTLLLLAPILLVYELFQLGACVGRGWLGAWVASCADTIDRAPALWRLRRAVQSVRRTPDRDLLIGGPLPFRPGLAKTDFERSLQRVLDEACVRYWNLVRQVL